jgi:hypothetical protein
LTETRRSKNFAAEPATPLSHVPIGTKTGGFASPPYGGFALSIARPVNPERCAYTTCLPITTRRNGNCVTELANEESIALKAFDLTPALSP